jgi:NADPH:quinone reductase-like Zn-dependent oxidoreductase
MYSAEDVICMQTPFNQVRLESIAPAPDESTADHHKAVTVQDIPEPEPDELLVKTLLSPIHPCDILSAAGLVPHRAGARDGRDNVQYLPGIEAVGQVEAVGSQLSGRFSPGDRVFMCCWSPWGRWQEAHGVWSEYVTVKPDNVIRVPDGVSNETAAMFLVIPVTAYVMMIEELGLQRGDWLIQNAAGSAVGRWVIGLANELGIHTINLVRREEQVEELQRETDAEHVMWCPSDGSLNDKLKEEIRALTGDAPVRGAFDAVADGQFATLMFEVMSRYGRLIVYGVLSGTSMNIAFDSSCRIALEGLRMKGFSLQNWWLPDTPDEEKARVFDAVWKHIENNDALNPAVGAIYPFEQVGQAIHSSLQQKAGKVLLCPRPQDADQYATDK